MLEVNKRRVNDVSLEESKLLLQRIVVVGRVEGDGLDCVCAEQDAFFKEVEGG